MVSKTLILFLVTACVAIFSASSQINTYNASALTKDDAQFTLKTMNIIAITVALVSTLLYIYLNYSELRQSPLGKKIKSKPLSA